MSTTQRLQDPDISPRPIRRALNIDGHEISSETSELLHIDTGMPGNGSSSDDGAPKTRLRASASRSVWQCKAAMPELAAKRKGRAHEYVMRRSLAHGTELINLTLGQHVTRRTLQIAVPKKPLPVLPARSARTNDVVSVARWVCTFTPQTVPFCYTCSRSSASGASRRHQMAGSEAVHCFLAGPTHC